MIKLSLIVAVQKNTNVIASNNSIPWNNSDDLQMFKKITSYTGISNYPNILICGYNTFKTLPELKDRIVIVLTKNNTELIFKNNYVCSSWIDIFNLIKTLKYTNIFVIGGKQLYEYAFNHPYFHELYLTIIDSKEKYENTISIDINYCKLKLIQNNNMFYHYVSKNQSFEVQYMNTLNEIMYNGTELSTRNSITRSINNVSIKIDLADGFPLLTIRKNFWKGIVEELLWFISGSTNTYDLQKKGVNIWNQNSTRQFLDNRGLNHLPEGSIGKAYGYQMRHLKVDQIKEVIHLLKNDPNSRRIMINLWNVDELNEMALPPCAFVYCFTVENGKLNCLLTQRSHDISLGWNISTASLLVHILAKTCDLNVGTVMHVISNCHIYQQHYECIKEILNNHPHKLPQLNIKVKRDNVEDYKFEDFELINYTYNIIKGKMEMIA